MYDFLEGELASKDLTEVVLDVGGIGYLLEVPVSTSDAVPAAGRARLWVHLHVREDALKLYGFATRPERELFRLLQKVSGIGPGVAVTILSRASVSEICGAIAEGRVDVLKSLKGVGPKTAQRLVTELADSVGGIGEVELPAGGAAPRSGVEDDAVQALEVLGCAAKPARAAVRQVLAAQPDAPLTEVVRKALKLVWPGR